MTISRKVFFAGCCGGVIGLCVAIVLGWLSSYMSLSPMLILPLWPTSIFGIAFNGPLTFSWTSILVIVLVFGGNALLYSIVVALLARLFFSFMPTSHEE